MKPAIITIGKRRYCVGMAWRSFDHAQKLPSLREMGRTMFPDVSGTAQGAQWYAMRPVSPEIVQCGFSRVPEGLKNAPPPGTYALAPLVASVRMQPWLGVFKLSDGLWWYIAVRDGHTILPDGDAIGDENAIIALREQHSSFGDWNYIQGTLSDLENLIAESQEKPSRVRALYRAPIPTKYIAASLAGLLAVGGMAWYLQHLHDQQAARKRQAALLRARAAMMQKKEPEKPNVETPLPDEWIRSCMDAAGSVPISIDGWVVKGFVCLASTNSLTLTWHREEGATIGHRPAGMLSADGDTVTDSRALPKLAKSSQAIQGNGREMLLAWAQALDVPLKLSAPVHTVLLPGQKEQGQADSHAAPRPAPITFSIEFPFLPNSLGLDGIHGVVVERLAFDGKKCTVSGSLQEK